MISQKLFLRNDRRDEWIPKFLPANPHLRGRYAVFGAAVCIAGMRHQSGLAA